MQTDFQGKSRGCPARRVCRAVGGNARPGHPIQLQPEGLLQLCVPAGELCLNFLLSAFCKSCSSLCAGTGAGSLQDASLLPGASIRGEGCPLPTRGARQQLNCTQHPRPAPTLLPSAPCRAQRCPCPMSPTQPHVSPRCPGPPPTNSRIQPASLLQHRVGAAWETTPLTASLLHRVAFSPAPCLPSQACPAPLKKKKMKI